MSILFKPVANKKFRCLRGNIVLLDGLISAGKTTLGKSIEKYLNESGVKCKFFTEYDNPLLNLYISNRAKYSFLFQLIMVRERIHIYQEATALAEQGYFVIIDRSLTGDYAFALMQRNAGFINEDEWNIYIKTISEARLIEPSAIIYLETDAETSFNRMIKRGNEAEVNGYQLSYFEELERSYIQAEDELKLTFSRFPWNMEVSLVDGFINSNACDKFIHHVIDILLEQ